MVIVTDAHQYLLDHFSEFDFIWASPPCPTHSRINKANVLSPYKDNSIQLAHGGGIPIGYPDMTLYQEIIFLEHFFKGKYCIENVMSYYEPLIPPEKIHRHYFWANFYIGQIKLKTDNISNAGNKDRSKRLGIDIAKYKCDVRKDKVLRNCVNPELAKHILDIVTTGKSTVNKQQELF